MGVAETDAEFQLFRSSTARHRHLLAGFSVREPLHPGSGVVGPLFHSEGGLHVARLIAGERIDPKGLLFAAVTSRSPSESFRWQLVDRYVQ